MVTLHQPMKNLISTYYTVTEVWKPTLKYNNLFNLTSQILGSYMQVFTVPTTV